MSASILRNLVSSVFGVEAKKVILSGEMPTNWYVEACHSHGSLYTHCDEVAVWGFNPKTGFIPVSGALDGYSRNDNGSGQSETLITFGDCAEVEGATFFLVKEDNYYRSNGETRESETYTLFKAPDFGAYMASVEAADLERWSNWISA